VILVLGGPGTGKTILSTQFLVRGAETYGENGVYVSLDESRSHIFREMSHMKWDLEELEKEKKLIVLDASPIRHVPGEVKVGKLTIGKRDFSMISLIDTLRKNIQLINAKRIALDPITMLIFQYPDPIQRRTAFMDLVEALMETGATCLLTSELRAVGLERDVELEEYLAHGVILLQTLQVGRALVRALQVEKMRETQADMQPRPYRITSAGIEVYPKESVF